MNRQVVVWVAALMSSSGLLVSAQTVPYSPGTLNLSASNTQGAQILPNSASTLLSFPVEGDTTGTNAFDVVSTDPGG